MIHIGKFQANVLDSSGNIQRAFLLPATPADVPREWSFDWPGIWSSSDFNYQGIIKFVYEDQVLGLMRYGLYPYPGIPAFLEVEQLEANPADRFVEPVGRWLLWYAVQMALRACSVDEDQTLVFLISLAEAIRYYRDRIQMEYLEPVTVAPGEDGYAFRFTRSAAQAFCRRQSAQWGNPSASN